MYPLVRSTLFTVTYFVRSMLAKSQWTNDQLLDNNSPNHWFTEDTCPSNIYVGFSVHIGDRRHPLPIPRAPFSAPPFCLVLALPPCLWPWHPHTSWSRMSSQSHADGDISLPLSPPTKQSRDKWYLNCCIKLQKLIICLSVLGIYFYNKNHR